MDELVSLHGIVLSSMPIGESDRRLLLLTTELGKISCFAKGARKPTSPYVGSTRPFALGEFKIYPGRNSYSLSGVSIDEYFEEIVKDGRKSCYGCYFLELAARFSHENTDGTPVLKLLYGALKALQEDRMPAELIRNVFELRILKEEGVLPDFLHCNQCGKLLSEGFFQPKIPGIVCKNCSPEREDYPIGGTALYALSHIASEPFPTLFRFTLKEESSKELSEISALLLKRELETPLSSAALLEIWKTE